MATHELLVDALPDEWGAKARLADDLQTSRTTVTNWAAGKAKIQPWWYVRLAEALGLEPRAFIDAAGLSTLVDGMDDDELIEVWSMLYPAGMKDPAATTEGVEAALKADPDLTPRQRKGLLAAYRNAVGSSS